MTQSTLAIPNEAGSSFRADNNTAHQANATFQSGASAPATTYADQYWYDTTAQVLKKRNQANSAWIVIATRDEAFVISRSSNTILGLSDIGKTFVATSTFTQTVTAAATLGDGWFCFYRNDGTGVITIDPNSTETIDGGLVLTLQPGEGCRIVCNGSAFKTQGLAWKITKRKTADESVTSSTTLQDDDHLTFPIGANEEWIGCFDLPCGSALSTTGIKVTISAPAGASFQTDYRGYPDGSTQMNIAGTSTAGNSTVDFTAGGWVAVTGSIKIAFRILNGATAGTIKLQWAQSTSSVTALTVRTGAFMTASKVA